MRGKLRELIAWELQDNWSFPILEIVVAIAIIQGMSFIDFSTVKFDFFPKYFFENMQFIIVISAALVFGKTFGDSIEKRKLIVLLSYPVSRTQIFIAKYLGNLLTLFLIFGSVLLAQGVSFFMFEGIISPVVWAFMFLYLFLAVLLASSLMSFIALAVKRFGLSILIFLIYAFGTDYWLSSLSIHDPIAHLRLDLGPYASVSYLHVQYANWLNLHAMGTFNQTHFSAALSYLLGGSLILLLASLLLIKKIDLD